MINNINGKYSVTEYQFFTNFFSNLKPSTLSASKIYIPLDIPDNETGVPGG